MPVVVPLAVSVPSVPMVATDVAVLLHMPPLVASVSNVADPSHNEKVPSIAVGWVFTVTVVVAAQLPIVYDTVEVPVLILLAVTVPPVLIVATVVVTLLHTPPPVASVSVMDAPWQIGVLPLIAAGKVVTVTTCVATQLPIR